MPTNAELAREVQQLRTEIEQLRESVSVMNTFYEEMKRKNELVTGENKSLQKSNDQLTAKIADMEQRSRINDIEIKGVPAKKGEDCTAILRKMGDVIGCPVHQADIDAVHRVPAKKDSNIIARFCSRNKKDEFLRKARKARRTTQSLGFPQSESANVYVNDHLTPENKRLFAQALSLKREKHWKFLWVDNGRIKARKSEDSRVHVITNMQDLSVIRE
ncbi:hypothetical protein HPB49_004321 [Dermacentor silvarum]|uniref:Uncharacterized protein n=1 Tax=Dermacentor silvarum TaxID=543639 RepID=A0ACB8CDA4_DERSI|nr:hypothetical protein HPB49_004321 [Dermacentor silvarum]